MLKEPVGVVGAITPWNYPLYQIANKVAPALAAGCTVVLKPSEVAPINAFILAEVIHDAGLPKGVFNLVTGLGPVVGEAIASHPLVDKVSFTGSTRAGKRVMELCAQSSSGSRSRSAASRRTSSLRTLTSQPRFQRVSSAATSIPVKRARRSLECSSPVPGWPRLSSSAAAGRGRIHARRPRSRTTGHRPARFRGPARQGPRATSRRASRRGRRSSRAARKPPRDSTRATSSSPTVFSNVSNDMTIAREEIFGPVLSIIPFDTEEEAIEIANDTHYGLAGAVSGPARRSTRSRSPRDSAPARSTSTGATSTRSRRSAATSSRASVASAAPSASRSSSR